MTPKKRKDAPNTNLPARPTKRNKLQNARALSSQPADAALKDGQLDVESFVRARAFEITALEQGMRSAKKALTTRAHQSVPRDLRRRTASHNVKRVPKRLRERARREMKEDRAETVEARRRKPRTSKGWMRADTIKRLKRLALLKGAQEEGREGATRVRIKPPLTINGVLSEGIKPESKFRKRQRSKTWLPTHIWHSKRAHMTTPVKPLWRFSLALAPTEKSYRPTHRASGERGAVAWDMSYMSTILLVGEEKSVTSLLTLVGVDGEDAWGAKGEKWRNGTRSWRGWVHERQIKRAIAPVTIIWCPPKSLVGHSEKSNISAHKHSRRASIRPERQVFIRVHPAAFLQLWNQLVDASKTQRPPVAVEDLRYEIGSIEITGPGSTEALMGTLWPTKELGDGSVKSPADTWRSLRGVTNPATLPANTVLPFTIMDPRLRYPPRSEHVKPPADSEQQLLETLLEWPPDKSPEPAQLFSRDLRFAASHLPSQKSINRRRGDSAPGTYPVPRSSDPEIPIILLASRSGRSSQGGQGTWTVLLPWKCVLPVWYTLLHYPLSTGGTVRFGGVQQSRQVAFEAGQPWFPGDFPGTAAGRAWEEREREFRRLQWERKPKGRRIEFTSVNLKNGEVGEIGVGWGCDWDTLMSKNQLATKEIHDTGGEKKGNTTSLFQLPLSTVTRLLNQPRSEPLVAIPEYAVCSIKITLLSRGTAPPCSRIYRLPTSNATLRTSWLSLIRQPKSISKRRPKQPAPLKSTTTDGNRIASYLSESELLALTEGPAVAGDENYPVVPPAEDLIGFVTEGGFCLSKGGGFGIGSIMIDKVLEGHTNGSDRSLCIVREAGLSVGRLARWQPI